MSAPQKIVFQLKRGGNFEGRHIACLWIDAGKDVTDGAVFPRRIHALQHDKHRVSAIGCEQLLQLVKPLTMLFKIGGSFFLVAVAPGVVGGEVRESYFLMGLDQVGTRDGSSRHAFSGNWPSRRTRLRRISYSALDGMSSKTISS